MNSGKLTSIERRAILSLSSIMGLRMIGLFMVLPVFALYAPQLQGATPLLIGIAMGIYGFSQALLQIPFGMLSDHLGRKRIITCGLVMFIVGSLLAGFAHSITLMIIGRALQGAGAVGSTTLALMADLTRENQRTKAMAIAGMSIGLSFALAMIIGPTLATWLSVNTLFYLAALLGVFAIATLYLYTPTPTTLHWQRDTEPELSAFFKLLITPELAKLNSGIFLLHAIFTATFVALPISLERHAHLAVNQQSIIYLPTLFLALIACLICIGMAERKKTIKPYFMGGIATIAASQIILWSATNFTFIALSVCLFFAGFTLLESFLPSLISRTAPAARKGTAMGIYSCAQFLGIFVGGVLGGWLYGKFSFLGVYLFCFALAICWLLLAYRMQPPQYLITHVLSLGPTKQKHWDSIANQLRTIPGIVEATFIAEESIAYLKIEKRTLVDPNFLHLKEQMSL